MAMQTDQLNQPQGRPGIDSKAANVWWLVLLSLAAIVPLWTVRYPNMCDYPNHLARWFVLFHMRDAGYHFTSLYAPAWGLLPYISPDILALALQYFLPIDVVGRCILSLCVVSTVLATYFFLKQCCPANVPLASFGILVALNPMFLMGSISYEFSLAFCLLVVGLWVNYCKSPKVVTAVGIVLSLMLVYLTHLMGFLVAGLAMGVYALFLKERWKRLGTLAAMSLPALLIFVLNPIRAGGGASFVYKTLTPWIKLKYLLFPVRLYTSIRLELPVLAGFALLIILVLINRRRLVWQPAWLTVCAILLLIYFAAPSDYGLAGAFMDVRFMPFVYVFLVAVVRFDRVPRYLYICLALLALLRVAAVEQMFVSRQPELKQLSASFEVIPRDARVVPLVGLPDKTVMGRGDLHHMEYGVIQRGFLDPALFHLQGVQPIRLVGSPYCPNIYCDPANEPANVSGVDWQQVANSYDYLWVHSDEPEVAALAARIGDQIYANDFVAVYRVRHQP